MQYEHPTLFEMAHELPVPAFDSAAVAEQAQKRYEAQRDPEDIQSEALPMDQAERLRVVHDIAGFYPTNNHELNRAFAIKDYSDTASGTAGYLNHILLHQMKTPKAEDPGAALRSVVSEMERYASKARADKTALLTFESELRDNQELSPLVSLRNASIATGIGQFVRQHDLSLVAESGGKAELPFNPLKALPVRNAYDVYSNSQPPAIVEARINEVLSNVRLWQANAIISVMIDEQTARFKFWAENISDARRHSIARGAASTALTRLGVADIVHA